MKMKREEEKREKSVDIFRAHIISYFKGQSLF